MQQGLRNPLLNLLLFLSVLTLVLSFPQSLDPRDDICDPNDCNGAVKGNAGDPSYDCTASSKRLLLLTRSPHLTKKETACIALGNCPGLDPPPVPQALNCKNCAKIKTAKEKFKGNCDPAHSKGYMSSHNCDGSSYLSWVPRMENAFLKEVACAGFLDEISNAEDGGAIGRYVRHAGAVGGDGKTRKVFLFVVYQTGWEGPQNGFRLALVKEGVRVDDAVERLKADVADDATEHVVLGHPVAVAYITSVLHPVWQEHPFSVTVGTGVVHPQASVLVVSRIQKGTIPQSGQFFFCAIEVTVGHAGLGAGVIVWGLARARGRRLSLFVR
ncbi:MAG: hypothetical protein Q9218_001356 [Villophora microphyllina]